MPIEQQSIPLYAGGPQFAARTYLQNLGASQSLVDSSVWDESGDTSATTWLGRTIQQSPFGSDQNSPLITAEEARRRMQSERLLFEVPDTGMREDTLTSMMERQHRKRAHQEAIEAGPSGLMAGARSFGIGLARQAIDPLNIAAAFIPIVGEGRVAMMLEQAGAGWLARAGVRAQIGAIEGAVGTAALEPGMHFMASQLQEDYTMADSLLNIAFGGVIGGGLHIGVGAIKDWRTVNGLPSDAVPHIGEVPAKGEIPERIAALPPEARADLGHISLAQALSGREIDVAAALDLAEITQRATDQERQPGFLKTAEDLLTQRQQDQMRSTPGFLQSALDKLALRELDAEAQAVSARIDERVQGETRQRLDTIEAARSQELVEKIRTDPPNVTASKLANLLESQQLRGELLDDVARLKQAAKERDLTPKELREKIELMQEAGTRDIAAYQRAGIPTEQIAAIRAAQRTAAEGVYRTARAGQDPEAGIPHDARALSQEVEQLVKDQAVPEGEKASATAMKDLREAEAELKEIIEQAGFTTSKGSTYQLHTDRTTRNKAARPEHHGDAGPQPTSEHTFYVDQAGLDKLAEFQTQGGPKVQIVSLGEGRYGIRYTEGKDAGKVEKRTVVQAESAPKVGLYPVELWKEGNKVHFGNRITELTGSSRVPGEASMKELFKAEDAAIKQAKDDAKIMKALATCRLRDS